MQLHQRPIAPGPKVFLLALVLAAGCASVEKTPAQDVRWLVDHGQFEEAVKKSADAAAQNPGDEHLQILHRDATVAYLLEQGRRLTFVDHDEDALAIFEEAAALDGQSRQVKDWVEKTKRKLATRWLDQALELHAKDDINGALKDYELALKYAPADKDALIGRGLSLAILNHRDGLGRTYFKDGLHALADYWLEQARSRFAYARKYQPIDPRTQERKTQVETLLAIQRMTLGRKFEGDRKFAAARNEYRLASALDPSNTEAKDAVERCKNELAASASLDKAGMLIVRGRFEEATKAVEAAMAKTTVQKDLCEGKMAAIREARFEQSYREAISLERDFRYEEAITKYTELLAEAQFYKDVITRKDTLEEYVKLASEIYAKAAAETAPAKKLDYLRQIVVFWPEYKDVASQIRELEKPQGQ
jgi:tetratricopeptide (TPR) repeat protein